MQGKRTIPIKKPDVSEPAPARRLTLKDYLRLANINKKSHSGSKSRSKVDANTDRSMTQKDVSISHEEL